MHKHVYFALVCVLTSSFVFAADNSKQIEVALRNRAESVAKANEIRAKALEKSRNETITQLMKLATKAYAEKDRLSETNAWKAILTLDRSHAKATQYFKDLGTLETVLKELPSNTDHDLDPKAAILGAWRCYEGGDASRFGGMLIFLADGTVQSGTDREHLTPWGKFIVDAGSVIVSHDENTHDRFTVVGDRHLRELWVGTPDWKSKAPNYFYYGIRQK